MGWGGESHPRPGTGGIPPPLQPKLDGGERWRHRGGGSRGGPSLICVAPRTPRNREGTRRGSGRGRCREGQDVGGDVGHGGWQSSPHPPPPPPPPRYLEGLEIGARGGRGGQGTQASRPHGDTWLGLGGGNQFFQCPPVLPNPSQCSTVTLNLSQWPPVPPIPLSAPPIPVLQSFPVPCNSSQCPPSAAQ